MTPDTTGPPRPILDSYGSVFPQERESVCQKPNDINIFQKLSLDNIVIFSSQPLSALTLVVLWSNQSRIQYQSSECGILCHLRCIRYDTSTSVALFLMLAGALFIARSLSDQATVLLYLRVIDRATRILYTEIYCSGSRRAELV